jgi:hypothetical protein
VSGPCVVVVAPADRLEDLKSRISDRFADVVAFTDAEVMRAVETIIARTPPLVVVEQQFATTPRGAALVERITSDPALTGSEVRLVAKDGSTVTAPRRAPFPALAEFELADETEPAVTGALRPAAVATPSGPGTLDRRGTRRAARYHLEAPVAVLVDGNAATLVDLSTLGAQVVSSTVLKPNQRVRVTLADEAGTLRLSAQIAWASFEIPPNAGPRYRAGLEFISADTGALNAFRLRHQ